MHGPTPPMPSSRRRNAILRLYDWPLFRDWAAWLTVAMLVFTPVALGTGKKTAGDTWPRWADVVFGTLTFVLLFGAFPAFIRLTLRRRKWRASQASNQHAGGSFGVAVAPDWRSTPLRMNAERPSAPARPTANAPSSHTQPLRAGSAADLPLERAPAEMVSHLPRDELATSQTVAAARQRQVHPIAHAARTLQLATSPRDEYEAVLRLAETVAVCVGTSAAAALRDDVAGVPAFDELRAAFVGRGVAFGHWINVISSLNSVLRSIPEPVQGLADAVRLGPKGSGLVSDLRYMGQERNRWAHSGGPRTAGDSIARLQQMIPVLERILHKVEFLRESPWVLIRSCALRRGSGDFSIIAGDLMTDHPDFGRRDFVSSVPLAQNTVYMLSRRGAIDLTPFIVVHDCPECHQTELCHADGLSREGVTLKSFARGHSMWDQDLVSDVERMFVVS